MALAATSLPAPVSPRISTGVPEAATTDMSFFTFMKWSAFTYEIVVGAHPVEVLLEDDVFLPQGLVLVRLQDHFLQFGDLARLREVIVSPELHGADCGIDGRVPCQHYHFEGRFHLLHLEYEFNPIKVGQFDVENSDVEAFSWPIRESGSAAGGGRCERAYRSLSVVS